MTDPPDIRIVAQPTTAELLTPPGRGAVACIRVLGNLDLIDQFFSAANRKPISSQPIDRICYGTWGEEDLVITRLDNNSAEVHCHGGVSAVERIFQNLEDVGVDRVTPDRRDQLSLADEFDLALQAATTRRTAHLLLRQRDLFPSAVKRLAQLSQAERVRSINQMLHWSQFGLHLTTPWKVVLCGPPNVGKSSLVNALVGYARTVVYDQPGTTRDVVKVETAFEGWPIEFSDTAGLRQTDDGLETLGIGKARQQIARADLVVIVCDARTGLTALETTINNEHPQALIVWNKIDLPDALDPQGSELAVSAKSRIGIDNLAQHIVARLVPEIPPRSQPFPVTTRQIDLLNQLQKPGTTASD